MRKKGRKLQSKEGRKRKKRQQKMKEKGKGEKEGIKNKEKNGLSARLWPQSEFLSSWLVTAEYTNCASVEG